MIPESLSNRVYFSALLPEVCPVTYSGLVEILDRYGVPHSLLEGTKDIWCRDYMPIQTIDNRFVLFRYEPTYSGRYPFSIPVIPVHFFVSKDRYLLRS